MMHTKAFALTLLATFSVMGVGGVIGYLLGGVLSDRRGRIWLTMWAMGISGSCALVTGFLFGAPPWLLVAVCFVWGVTVIADSAQFSASVTELSPSDLVGTNNFRTNVQWVFADSDIHSLDAGYCRGIRLGARLYPVGGWAGFRSLSNGPPAPPPGSREVDGGKGMIN